MIRTLLVDDEPVFLAISKAFLEKEDGIACETCESAQAGLDLIRRGSFDAVVSDFDMPRMDGIALLKAVREQEPDLPFILLTGRGREEVVIQALNHGADFYLQKSTEPRALYMELASKIRHAVDRRRAREALMRTQFSIDHLSAEFYWIDPQGFLIDVNEFACQKLGYTRDELLRKRVPDVDPDFDIEGFNEAWQEVWQNLKENQSLRIESHHKKRDGTVYPVELSLSYCLMGEKEFMCAFATDITDRKRAERTLQESREQYRQLVKHSPYGIIIHHEGAVLFCNRIAAEILGVDDEREVIGKPVLEAVHPDYRDLVVRRIEQLLDNHHFIAPNIEETFIRLDGSAIDVEVTGGQVTFDGKPAIQVVFQDITDRKQRENERLALETQLETEIRDLNILHSLSTRYLEGDNFNTLLQEILEAAIAITGADKGNLQLLDPATGMLKIVAQKHFNPPFLKFFEYVDAGDATACGAALERLERVVVEDICESPVFDEETAEVLLEEDLRAVQSTPLVSRNGHLLGILSTHFCRVHAPAVRELRLVDILARQAADMIERTRGEEKLRESEQEYRDLVENANLIILKMDTRGNITFFNEFAQRFFGYTLDEVLGRNVVGTIVPETESSGRDMSEIIRDVCTNPEEYKNHENENITRDGRRVWIQWTNRAVCDERGARAGLLCIGNDITEQKRVEESLRENEQRYRELFESMGEGFVLHEIVYDEEGRPVDYLILDINPAYETNTGLQRDQVIGRGITEIVPYVEPIWFERYNDVVRTGRSTRFEEYNAGIDKWFSIYAYPVHRENQFAVILTDITERKRMDEGLRESEDKYRTIVETANEGIWEQDDQHVTQWVNPTMAAMLGYGVEEMVGRPVPDFLYEEDLREHAKRQAQRQEGLHGKYECRLKHRDGTDRWTLVSAIPKRDETGKTIGSFGMFMDITERKRAEENLKESEQRLNLAIESAHLGAWDKNLIDGEVITQGYWPGLLGYTDYDDVPPWEEAVHPDDRERVANDLQAHMQGETPCVKLEYRMKRKDGRYSWILSRGKVVERDDGGRPLRMIGVDHDISPLHASRESLREANRKLNLLSSITRHDILNQVSAQKAFLALLEEHIPADTEAQGLYQHLLATSDTIRRQITFTGDYQHMGERDPEWLHVRWVVKRAAESVRLNGNRLEIATPLPEIFADPMLEKAFFNLLENATVHGNSPITIRVSFHSRDGEGVIVLEDDGVGIQAAQKEEIFEKGIGKNTGLGLFLTREILEITGIFIRECGEEGRGARFEIAIPRGKWRMEGVEPV